MRTNEERVRLIHKRTEEIKAEKKKQQEIIWMSCQKQITQEKGFCWLRIMS